MLHGIVHIPFPPPGPPSQVPKEDIPTRGSHPIRQFPNDRRSVSGCYPARKAGGVESGGKGQGERDSMTIYVEELLVGENEWPNRNVLDMG